MKKHSLDKKGTFTDRVQTVVKSIPRGKTMTYGEVVTKAGHPLAARAVGVIMKHNKDTSIPCHRVVAKKG